MLTPAKGGYRIKSHTSGKTYPKVYSKAAGEKRIKQMEWFKYMKAKNGT